MFWLLYQNLFAIHITYAIRIIPMIFKHFFNFSLVYESKRNITCNLFQECFDGNEYQTQQSSDNSNHIDNEGDKLEESTAKLTKKDQQKKKKIAEKSKEDAILDPAMLVLFKEPNADDAFGQILH